MWKTTRRIIKEHALSDEKSFVEIAKTNTEISRAVSEHDAKGATRHAENVKAQEEIKATVSRMEGAINVLAPLIPAIQRGVEIDQHAIYRKKLAKRIAGTVLATCLTISALIPLVQWISGLKVTVHF